MLIFFSGSIGDSLITLPFLKKFRALYPDETIRLIHDTTEIGCRELLAKSGYIDEFFAFHRGSGITGKISVLWQLGRMLLSYHDHKLIYLLRSQKNMEKRIRRDKLFFRIMGIRSILGCRECFPFPEEKTGSAFPEIPHHIDLLAKRMRADGICLSEEELSDFDLQFQPEELAAVKAWNEAMRSCAGARNVIAVGIGGNKEICRWPIDRYIEVLKQLVKSDEIYPVFFGGPKDEPDIRKVLQSVGTGALAGEFGKLSLRETVAAMRNCSWYLGNDTGTLHMAVAAGLKCVAVYSAHNYRGLWYPYGTGHQVLRAQIDCEVCYRKNCPHHCPQGDPAKCLLQISTDDVLQKCTAMGLGVK